MERGVYAGVMYGLYSSRMDVRASDWRVGWESSGLDVLYIVPRPPTLDIEKWRVMYRKDIV